jgi:hypothetical protein
MKKIIINFEIRKALSAEFKVSRPTLNNALYGRTTSYSPRFEQNAERDRQIRERALELGGIEVEPTKEQEEM